MTGLRLLLDDNTGLGSGRPPVAQLAKLESFGANPRRNLIQALAHNIRHDKRLLNPARRHQNVHDRIRRFLRTRQRVLLLDRQRFAVRSSCHRGIAQSEVPLLERQSCGAKTRSHEIRHRIAGRSRRNQHSYTPRRLQPRPGRGNLLDDVTRRHFLVESSPGHPQNQLVLHQDGRRLAFGFSGQNRDRDFLSLNRQRMAVIALTPAATMRMAIMRAMLET